MVKQEKERRKNNVSPEGRARMGIAGTKNMTQWHASGAVRVVAAENQDAVNRATALIDKTIAELGGEMKLSARQAALIESQRTCLLVLMLAQVRLKRRGVHIRSGQKPDALLGVISTYSVLVRKNLDALGVLKGDPVPGDTIAEINAEYAEKHRREAAVAAEASDGNHDS
jgi:hypothetical protein